MRPVGIGSAVALVLAASQVVVALRPGIGGLSSRLSSRREIKEADSDPDSHIKAYNMSVPVDHFHNETKYEPHSHDTFQLRYWVDSSAYRDGGPVIILHSGEAPSDERLPFLRHGILAKLAKATGGVGIVLEHRYYGTSWPPVADEDKDKDEDKDRAGAARRRYRFLTTDQALADTAYFSSNLRLDLDPTNSDWAANGNASTTLNLAAPATPHILYGGSYAGGFVALARKLYPDVFWGAISSSGVTVAIDEFWQYLEAVRHYAPGDCSPTMQRLTSIIDSQLLGSSSSAVAAAAAVKALFGLQDLWNDEFAALLSEDLGAIQATNWDPAEDSTDFGTFCAVISSPVMLFSSTAHLRNRVDRLVRSWSAPFDEPASSSWSSPSPLATHTAQMLNYIGYIRNKVERARAGRSCKGKKNLRECLSDRLQPIEDDDWQKSWLYQTCTEWGYFLSGNATPPDRQPLASRALTSEYSSWQCRTVFNITAHPDVDIINRHGGYNFSYPRLAFIDGKQDPWRSAGPHAYLPSSRPSTPDEPFELIDWGVHHWDENGLGTDDDDTRPVEPGLPPIHVARIQDSEVDIVKHWLHEFERSQATAIGEL